MALARHTKKDLPEDLQGNRHCRRRLHGAQDPDAAPVWAGGGSTTHFALQSKVLNQDLELGEVEFSIPEEKRRGRKRAKGGQTLPIGRRECLSACRGQAVSYATWCGVSSNCWRLF